MERTCFRFVSIPFSPKKFISLHYLDQLHLVSSHASWQMFPKCFVVRYLLSSSCDICSRRNSWNEKKILSFDAITCTLWAKNSLENIFHVLFRLSRMLQLSQSVELPVESLPSPSRCCHEWKCVLCHATLHNIIVFNKQISLSLHLIVKR